jgi:IS5 family transposase
MGRNYLAGEEGDRTNAILSACGFNIRKLLAAFLFWLISKWQKMFAERYFLLAA